jgi:hypothetical protein
VQWWTGEIQAHAEGLSEIALLGDENVNTEDISLPSKRCMQQFLSGLVLLFG